MDYNTSANGTAMSPNRPDLQKETLVILLILVSIFSIALLSNILFALLYGCCPNQTTNKQRVLLHVLNLGLLLSTAAHVYLKYYEHEAWNMGDYGTVNCKAIRFTATAGSACYSYCLIALAWDSIAHLKLSISLNEAAQNTVCQLLTPVVIAVIMAVIVGSVAAIGSESTVPGSIDDDYLYHLCTEAGPQYGKIFQIYSTLHDAVWLSIVPAFTLLIVYMHSCTVFGCKGAKVNHEINTCEDEEFQTELECQHRWLNTVKSLVFIYMTFFIPVVLIRLLLVLFEHTYFFSDYSFPPSVSILLKRLTIIIESFLAVLTPGVLIIRHGCRRVTPAPSAIIESTAL